MQPYLLVLCNIFIISLPSQAAIASGLVDLDEFSFEKVINKFEVSLVKFDVSYPYGDKHDEYMALAKESSDVDNLLIATVGVKDYGSKDNENLAKKYGATKENFPLVKLFAKDKSEPITFDDSKEFSSDELRRFVRQNTGLYLKLPGCVKDLDILAIKFMKSKGEDKKNVLNITIEALKNLRSKDAASGKIYKMYMEKIIEKGDDFIETEHKRLKKILSSKVSDEKKKEIQTKVNILQTFQLSDKQTEVKKEDL